MDKICIKDLEVYANHGVFPEEKKLGQKFLISIELFIDLYDAGISDDLNKTINYGLLCEQVEIEFKSKCFNLLEAAAENLCSFILKSYNTVLRVKLMIKKPWAPIGKPLSYASVELDRTWHNAFIALGSNIGDKKANITNAIKLINSSDHTKIITQSASYETKPVGYTEQDDFINAVVQIKTTLNPKKLLHFLLEIEKELKRERIIRWGPRTIDLDIILYDDIVTNDEEVIIPHPRMHERMFVLEPLCEIAPFIIHPLLNRRMFELKELIAKK